MSGRLGILLSGRGSNFLAIRRNIQEGRLAATIACVVSDNPAAPGLEAARQFGLPAYFVDPSGRKRREYEAEIIEILETQAVDLVCLAGYMRLLSPGFVQRFPWRILNIHPALLPAFPGLHAQKQALEYGVKFSGCTVHFVDQGMDTGPIVAQAVVEVRDDDTEETLADRILHQEHKVYSEAIQRVLTGSYRVEFRRVKEI
jgi:phosphoribosylglycinamide formyltransferase-1